MQRNWILQIIILCTISIVASVSVAQGVNLGQTQLNSSFTFGLGYDSNVFRQDQRQEDVTLVSSTRAQFTPLLRLTTPNPRAFDLTAIGLMTWEQYLNDRTSDQSGGRYSLNANARINPRGDYSLLLGDGLKRSNNPAFLPNGDTEHILMNEISAGIGLHPGGSQISSRMGLTGEFLAIHRLWRYSEAISANRSSIGATLNLGYHFLPMTGLTYQGSVHMVNFDAERRVFISESSDATRPTVSNIDSLQIRQLAGFQGLVSERVTVRLGGGYGISGKLGADTWLARAGVGYLVNADDSLDLSYEHNFTDTSLGTGAIVNKFKFSYDQDMHDYDLSIGSFIQQYRYTSLNSNIFSGDPSGMIFGGDARLGVPIEDWFSVGAKYSLSANITELGLSNSELASSQRYIQHSAFLTLTFNY